MDRLEKLCRSEGQKSYFEEGYSSYYQTYNGPNVAAIYYKNKFLNKTITVIQEFQLSNMQIRGEAPGVEKTEFFLAPNEGHLAIIDVIKPDASFVFQY